MKLALIKAALLFFFCGTITYADATDSSCSSSPKTLTVGASAGLGLLGAGWDASLIYQSGNNLIGTRYFRNHEIRGELAVGGNPGFSRPLEYFWEADALVGKTATDKGFTASIMFGLGAFGGTLRGKLLRTPDTLSSYNEFEHLDQTTIGIPLEGRLAFTPIENFDLGISVMLNLNSKRTLKGFFVSFRLLYPFLKFLD